MNVLEVFGKRAPGRWWGIYLNNGTTWVGFIQASTGLTARLLSQKRYPQFKRPLVVREFYRKEQS